VIIVTTSQPFIIVAEAIVTLTAVFGGAEGWAGTALTRELVGLWDNMVEMKCTCPVALQQLP
jgi:hypothetical protein